MSKRNVVHVEIPAANVPAAGRFYQALFGWKLHEVPDMNYTMWEDGAGGGGGFPQVSPESPAGRVLVYIDSEDIEADLRKATQDALATHGYNIERTGQWDEQSRRVMMNFQMRYRPGNYEGQPDAESAAILWVLTNPAPKAPAKKRTPNAAFMKPLTPSPALAAVVGSAGLPRTEVVSKMWTYIKKNKLQDAVNKRMINADDKLKAVFGKAQVSMFEMAALIGKHLK